MSERARRLSREDWERAALEAIRERGAAGVAVEPLARRLGVTKGSFYAHFRDRDELLDAALERWERTHAEAFAAARAAGADPGEQLRTLVEQGLEAARSGSIQGRLLLEASHPRVRAALRRVTEVRLRRLEAIFGDLGRAPGEARVDATLAYATYVGLLQLAREVPERLADEPAVLERLLETLGAGPPARRARPRG